MIVKMRHLDLICVAADKEATLERLRDLGAVHLDLHSAAGASVSAAKGEAAAAERAVRIILKAREGGESGEVRPHPVSEVLQLDADREKLKGDAEELKRTIARYEPYGDFDPALARKVLDAGVSLDGVAELPDPLPPMRLSEMRAKLDRTETLIATATAKLAGCDEKAILKLYPQLADKIAFEAAKETMSEKGAVAFVSGWVAERRVADVADAAHRAGWGLLVREPEDGESPPTLIEPPKLFRPVKVLFDGLGIAPAYNESDVSVPFMCYFSLFFAMLVGDGGYGAIMLAATLWGWFRYRSGKAATPLVKSWLVLMTVFSSGTIVWGLLSNTWFGAGLPFAEDWPTVRWLGGADDANPYDNMMLLCFTIGASHLVLARLWNGICRINSVDCLPEFGWAGIVVFMYLVVNAIVGISAGVPAWSYWLLGVSLALVASRTRGVSLGMLPLNVMGVMGDIISYVRLFAVGYASLQVARNFNDMALGLDLPVWAKVVPMVAILLVGHGINFVLAGLSILVHAVRLNTLEFSNHKGLTWSGYAFSAFRKHTSTTNKE